MSILFVLIPLSLVLVIFAGWAFFWAVDKGQFDDLDMHAWSVLQDDSTPRPTRGELVDPPVRGEPLEPYVCGERVSFPSHRNHGS